MTFRPPASALVPNPAYRPTHRTGRGLSACSPLRRLVWERDAGRCVLCGVECVRHKRDRYDANPRLGEIDHIIPIIRGGGNTLENLRLLCKACNRRKGVSERGGRA